MEVTLIVLTDGCYIDSVVLMTIIRQFESGFPMVKNSLKENMFAVLS